MGRDAQQEHTTQIHREQNRRKKRRKNKNKKQKKNKSLFQVNRERVIIFYILFTFRDLMIIYIRTKHTLSTTVAVTMPRHHHICTRCTRTVCQSTKKLNWNGVVDLLIVSLHFYVAGRFCLTWHTICKQRAHIYSFSIFDLINIILLILHVLLIHSTQLILQLTSRQQPSLFTLTSDHIFTVGYDGTLERERILLVPTCGQQQCDCILRSICMFFSLFPRFRVCIENAQAIFHARTAPKNKTNKSSTRLLPRILVSSVFFLLPCVLFLLLYVHSLSVHWRDAASNRLYQ